MDINGNIYEARLLLQQAGLTITGEIVASQSNLPPPRLAWKCIASGTSPTLRFDEQTSPVVLSAAWMKQALRYNVISLKGYLISLSRPYIDNVWFKVKHTHEQLMVAEHLTVYSGEPEFVAMSLDGKRICGITTEEHGFWVTCREVPPDLDSL